MKYWVKIDVIENSGKPSELASNPTLCARYIDDHSHRYIQGVISRSNMSWAFVKCPLQKMSIILTAICNVFKIHMQGWTRI